MDNKYKRILGNTYHSNDCFRTRLNNNDLIIGPSGAGKTSSYVLPNLLQQNENLIVVDTKNSLYKRMKPYYEANGYHVYKMDFVNTKNSMGYNPFSNIRYDPRNDIYNEQDIIKIAYTIITDSISRDKFWDNAARQYLKCLLGYVLEFLPEEEHTMPTLNVLFGTISSPIFTKLMDDVMEHYPNSFTAHQYDVISRSDHHSTTVLSIYSVLGEQLSRFAFDGARQMFANNNTFDITRFTLLKSICFINVSDTDRSLDQLINLFYTQLIQKLCFIADNNRNQALPIPVRIIFDDFATNTVIPDFDNIISVIRSRNISVSIILQSLTQLSKLYGDNAAKTIINNCDNWLYLGGCDIETAQVISTRTNTPVYKVLNQPLDKLLIIQRGHTPQWSEQFKLKDHPQYRTMMKQKTA